VIRINQGSAQDYSELLFMISREHAGKLRWIFLAFAYCASAAYGAEAAISRELAASNWPIGISLALGFTSACICDAKVVGKRLTHAAQWVMFFSWPVTAPIYLIWSRGARGLLALGLQIVFVLMSGFAGAVVSLTAYALMMKILD
jgi:hypothetical protein